MTSTFADPKALLQWVESLKNDPDVLAAIEDGENNPIDFLQINLESVISKMNVTSDELDKMIEQSGEFNCGSRMTAHAA